MLVSPTEPFPIKALGTVSYLPERFGADVMIMSKKMRTGVQRKKFPEDFIASLADGRLYQQVEMMRQLDRSMLIIEGFGQWTSDDMLMDARLNFSRQQLFALFFSISFEFGLQIFQVRDINDTIRMLRTLDVWAQKDKHNSLRSRPGPAKDAWGRRGSKEYAAHLLQSFQGIGPELAMRMVEHFGKAPIQWEVTEEELRGVPGVGKLKAKKIWEALNG
jgi:ERCC4-type nuclease